VAKEKGEKWIKETGLSVHSPSLEPLLLVSPTTTTAIMSSPNSLIFTPSAHQVILASHMMHTTGNVNDEVHQAAQKFDKYFYPRQQHAQCFGTRRADNGHSLDIYLMRGDVICAAIQKYSQLPPTIACCLYPEADHQPYFDLCINTTSSIAGDWVEYEGEGVLWITGDSGYVSTLCYVVQIHIWDSAFRLKTNKMSRKIFDGLKVVKFQGERFLASEFHGKKPQLWLRVIV
jgi:hypothetical protein